MSRLHVPRLNLSCREASRLASESLDRELARHERWSLRIHSTLCPACRRFVEQLRAIRGALVALPNIARERWLGAGALSAERRERIKLALIEARRGESLH